MTVAALVTEHQDAQPFLQFVADVFNGAKAPITTALQTAVLPSLRAAAQESEQAKKEKALTDYETALAAALVAAEACAEKVSNPCVNIHRRARESTSVEFGRAGDREQGVSRWSRAA